MTKKLSPISQYVHKNSIGGKKERIKKGKKVCSAYSVERNQGCHSGAISKFQASKSYKLFSNIDRNWQPLGTKEDFSSIESLWASVSFWLLFFYFLSSILKRIWLLFHSKERSQYIVHKKRWMKNNLNALWQMESLIIGFRIIGRRYTLECGQYLMNA